MPAAELRGVRIHYEVVGDHGPWVALSPGSRRELEAVQPLAELIAPAGFRVLLHDRRNCGSSDVVIDGQESEYEIWADDLHLLLLELGAAPAFVGGSSSGCRLSLLMALRHPEAVRGLLLWRVTGGAFAAERLAHNYYGQYIELARQGGMAAVCDSEFFRERIASYPPNRQRLMGLAPERFIEVMEHWRSYFVGAADLPVIGAGAEELAAVDLPACVIPGNDWTHPRHVGENASRLLPRAELHILMPDEVPVDLSNDGWDEKRPEMAGIFVDFMKRVAEAMPVRG